jgi:hypothetical protein
MMAVNQITSIARIKVQTISREGRKWKAHSGVALCDGARTCNGRPGLHLSCRMLKLYVSFGD